MRIKIEYPKVNKGFRYFLSVLTHHKTHSRYPSFNQCIWTKLSTSPKSWNVPETWLQPNKESVTKHRNSNSKLRTGVRRMMRIDLQTSYVKVRSFSTEMTYFTFNNQCRFGNLVKRLSITRNGRVTFLRMSSPSAERCKILVSRHFSVLTETDGGLEG